MNIRFEDVSIDNYHQYYEKIQGIEIGPMLTPKTYNDSLWGTLVFDQEELVGGWVGKKRFKNKYLKALVQEIYFDSMPQVFNSNKIGFQQIIDKQIEKAKVEHISYLSVSHWSRSADEFECKYFNLKKMQLI
jgi:hypothetical protein